MRYIKHLILFVYITLSIDVLAATCSYKDQTILNNDFSNIKITYEVINDNEINILIYNLTENIYLTFQNPDTNTEQSVYYSDTTNGKYIIKRNTSNLEEYSFKVRSNMSDCYGNILTTKNIIKPKYNEFHTLEICDNKKLKNHSYCQKFITKEINVSKSEVIKVLEDFLKVHVDVITTEMPKEEGIEITTIVKYSLIGIITIGIIIAIIVIIKKRGEL